MIKLYRIIKFFFVYRKNILKNRKYLEDKYGFNINLLLEIYTTVTLVDAPAELKEKMGKALVEIELKKFIGLVNADLPKLDLEELVNVYEIKRIDDENWGIAFGYALANNTKLILSFVLTAAILLTGLLILIF
jgi:hypothetical protein